LSGLLLGLIGINSQTNQKKMKKAFTVIAACMIAASFVACGPSAEDKAKMEEREKQMKDSMANAISNDMENANDSNTTAAPATTETTAPEHH
jgi:hypothetical protein